jgi:hypothetical protein
MKVASYEVPMDATVIGIIVSAGVAIAIFSINSIQNQKKTWIKRDSIVMSY